MPQSDSLERKKNEQPNRIKKPQIIGWLLFIIFFVAGAVTITGIALRYRGFDNVPASVEFLTENSLNFLLLDAVILQAVIYFQQRKLMQGQLRIMGIAVEPRLRVTNIRAVDLEAGKNPAFIMWIINEGATDAEDVELFMRASLGPDESGHEWSRPQIVTIPARQEEHYWIQWTSAINQERIDAVNNRDVSIEVSGYFRLRDVERRSFCYRFHPWKGRRPRDVSQFIPCDFNPGLTCALQAADGFQVAEDYTLTKTMDDQQKEKAVKEPRFRALR